MNLDSNIFVDQTRKNAEGNVFNTLKNSGISKNLNCANGNCSALKEFQQFFANGLHQACVKAMSGKDLDGRESDTIDLSENKVDIEVDDNELPFEITQTDLDQFDDLPIELSSVNQNGKIGSENATGLDQNENNKSEKSPSKMDSDYFNNVSVEHLWPGEQSVKSPSAVKDNTEVGINAEIGDNNNDIADLKNPNCTDPKGGNRSDTERRKISDQSLFEKNAEILGISYSVAAPSTILSIANTLSNAASIQGIGLGAIDQKNFPNQVLKIAQEEYCDRCNSSGLASIVGFLFFELGENLFVNFFDQDQVNGIIDDTFRKLLNHCDSVKRRCEAENFNTYCSADKKWLNIGKKLETNKNTRNLAKLAIKSALFHKALFNAHTPLANCYLGTLAKVMGCSIMVKSDKHFILYRCDGGFCVEQNFRQRGDGRLARDSYKGQRALLEEKDSSIIKSAIFVEYDGMKLLPMSKEAKDTLIAASAKDTEA